MNNELHATRTVEWEQVRPFLEEHGCVVDGHPEIRWYQESWGALERAGLTSTTEFKEFELAQTILKLKALCLLAMYLGMYQVSGEYSELGGYFSEHDSSSSYLCSLNIEMEVIWELARRQGYLETAHSSYWEEKEVDDEMLHDIAMEMVSNENKAIFRVLDEHYGGNNGLFVSMWNSRWPLEEVEPVENVLNSATPEKLEVWSYVKEGMEGWWWT